MGYTTDFSGEFNLDKPLTDEHQAYLEAFAGTRRMKRMTALTDLMDDPVRKAVGLPVGVEGGYYVGGADNDMGQTRTDDVADYNSPPEGQPGLWLGWIPDGDTIVWDGGEKFYNYVEWLEYIVEHFLKPWGYSITGQVHWQGESDDDRGTIYAKDNKIEAIEDDIKPGKPSWET
jgi:hypothetical protein